ncbi:hypothetical protein EV690_1563 [Celerinatantimonas diazotrophica]|uniref:Uncharacterized protein n=1 Tax=Celerinatantimonas diazotrophica TaxID=412034 RepID=A0A4R1K1L3_9GAMM|nr:hypothetical protein EV690_1563 [Celerinatantimonas diazotrophica]CAG9298069.1 hypothetical protein CEDIAZO_03264 [Celerinatantimonas diazotrophica]
MSRRTNRKLYWYYTLREQKIPKEQKLAVLN